MKSKLTKGKLSKKLASSTVGVPATVSAVMPITAFDIFESSLKRAENLYQLQKKSKVQDQFNDVGRAAIVLAIAALDAYVRTFVIERILAKLVDLKQTLPKTFKERTKELLNHDEMFDAARNGDLNSRIEKAFRESFEEKTFQGVKHITDAMKLIGHDEVFHIIADSASVNEDHLKGNLGRFTKRRHLIAHCGDYDLSQTPPKENKIDVEDVRKCIEAVKLVAQEICKLK